MVSHLQPQPVSKSLSKSQGKIVKVLKVIRTVLAFSKLEVAHLGSKDDGKGRIFYTFDILYIMDKSRILGGSAQRM